MSIKPSQNVTFSTDAVRYFFADTHLESKLKEDLSPKPIQTRQMELLMKGSDIETLTLNMRSRVLWTVGLQ